MGSANGVMSLAGTPVPAGKSVRVEIPVARLSTGTEVHVPVTVVNGRHEGPKLLLSAAIHGDELNGVEIVRQVVADVDPRSLRGTLIAVPVVNVFGYLTQSRYLPDRRDLNRSFPGSAKGSLASQLAHLFVSKIVSHADFAIDFHTGSDGRTNVPQIRADLGDGTTRMAALEFGAPVVLHAKLRANSYRATAAGRGLPMLLFEGGETMRFEREVIRIGVQGVWRVMGHLGMRPGTNEALRPGPFVAGDSSWLRARHGGLFHTATFPGDRVKKGEVLGRVMDVFGRQRAKVVAPWDGMVVGMVVNPQVTRGDGLLHLARHERDCRPERTTVTDD